VALAALVSTPGSDPAALRASATRAGRFMNATTTNSLGVTDDALALALFLRDRAQRSPHTLRAYRTELRRLIGWCEAHRRGPLSDLTRDDLLAFRHTLGPAGSIGSASSMVPFSPHAVRASKPSRSDASRRRGLAVISSLFRYWQKTGYLIINPAAELSGGGAARMTWTPARILPAQVLTLCDTVTAGARPPGVSVLVWARRCAIWTLYRFAGVRLAELEWSAELGLPRLSVEPTTATVAGPAHGSSVTLRARAAGLSRAAGSVRRARAVRIGPAGSQRETRRARPQRSLR
jgi:integrase/recombinase XerC